MGGRGLSHLVDLEAYITEHLEGEKKRKKKNNHKNPQKPREKQKVFSLDRKEC